MHQSSLDNKNVSQVQQWQEYYQEPANKSIENTNKTLKESNQNSALRSQEAPNLVHSYSQGGQSNIDRNTLQVQIEEAKQKLQKEVEIEALRQKQIKEEQFGNFVTICDETKAKYQHIFEKIQEAEVKTFGEQNRASITETAMLNSPEQLYAKFNEQRIDPNQMKEFVQYQYLKVLEQRK